MRRGVRWLLPLLALPFLALLAFGLTRDTFVLPTPLIGEAAPAFHLETLDGDSLALEELRGQVVVLNFWASWCLPCRGEHDVLRRAEEEYAGRDVRIVGVVYQDSRVNARRFLEQLGGGWTSVLDPATRTAIDYGVYGVPETFFLDREGRVAYKQVGPLTWEIVSARVDSLLAGWGGREAAGG
ncbi:MAG: TlpA family protein disulfide reductase [Gemmatimonadota bacterium]